MINENVSLIDYFAINAPPAPKLWIETERIKDQKANPFNESHLRLQRSDVELEICWRWEFARKMIAEKERM